MISRFMSFYKPGVTRGGAALGLTGVGRSGAPGLGLAWDLDVEHHRGSVIHWSGSRGASGCGKRCVAVGVARRSRARRRAVCGLRGAWLWAPKGSGSKCEASATRSRVCGVLCRSSGTWPRRGNGGVAPACAFWLQGWATAYRI